MADDQAITFAILQNPAKIIVMLQPGNPDWIYKHSENLNQNIAFDKKTGWVYCDDGTKYSPEENDVPKAAHKKIPLQVHILKKVFDGVLLCIESR